MNKKSLIIALAIAITALVVPGLVLHAYAAEKKSTAEQEMLIKEVRNKLAKRDSIEMYLPDRCSLAVDIKVAGSKASQAKTVRFFIQLKGINIGTDPNSDGIIKLDMCKEDGNKKTICETPIEKSVDGIVTDTTYIYIMAFHHMDVASAKEKLDKVTQICNQSSR